MGTKDRAVDLAYRAGWGMTKKLPERVAKVAFDDLGGLMGRRPGAGPQLRKNLARVLGVPPAQVPDDLMAFILENDAEEQRWNP